MARTTKEEKFTNGLDKEKILQAVSTGLNLVNEFASKLPPEYKNINKDINKKMDEALKKMNGAIAKLNNMPR